MAFLTNKSKESLRIHGIRCGFKAANSLACGTIRVWKGRFFLGREGGPDPLSGLFFMTIPHPELLSSLSRMPFPFSMAVFTLETDNPSKLTEKQMDKVSWIVHPKLRLFHFQIKTQCLSDANYPTDNPSQADNPSQV